MCRHLAYLGPPVTLADLVLHQPHSLLHQSWAPTDMRGVGTVNADGFGIGWLVGDPGAGGAARRYRRDRPIWSDASLPDLAASISSGAILAAVRNATAGMPVTETACAPFMEGAWMFSHNGGIERWPTSVAPLADALPPEVLMTLDAPTDSAFLWALVRQHLREGRSAAKALAGVVGDVLALAPRSRLNLLLHDGLHIAATTAGHALWLHDGDGSVTVSSEVLVLREDPPPARRAAGGGDAARVRAPRRLRKRTARRDRHHAPRLSDAGDPRRRRRLHRAPGPRPGSDPTAGRIPRRHDRQPLSRRTRHLPGRAARHPRPRRMAAARHRPGEGPRRAGPGLRRCGRRHRGVQSQPPGRPQPRAGRRLRRRELRARRDLGPRERVDRDEATEHRRCARDPLGARARHRPRDRGGDPDGDLGQVPQGGIEHELATAGFGLDSWWTDAEGRFALSLARAR